MYLQGNKIDKSSITPFDKCCHWKRTNKTHTHNKMDDIGNRRQQVEFVARILLFWHRKKNFFFACFFFFFGFANVIERFSDRIFWFVIDCSTWRQVSFIMTFSSFLFVRLPTPSSSFTIWSGLFLFSFKSTATATTIGRYDCG